jgi:hypothetical protein
MAMLECVLQTYNPQLGFENSDPAAGFLTSPCLLLLVQTRDSGNPELNSEAIVGSAPLVASERTEFDTAAS